MRRFTDRTEAGRELGAMLHSFARDPDVVVVGLSRGGVPVAREVAEALEAALDVLTVRRLVIAGNHESSLGAVAAGGETTIDWRIADAFCLSNTAIEALIARERDALDRTDRLYRSVKAPVDLGGRTVIVVDDGIVSGTTMATAIDAVRRQQPGRVIAAAPVASRDAQAMIRHHADGTVVAYTPARMYGLDLWYEEFAAISDAEAIRVLRGGAARQVTPVRLMAHA